MTRRDLGKLAAGTGIALQARAASTYTGALDGFEEKVDPREIDPVFYGRKLHDAAPLRLTFRASRRPEAEKWQRELRSKLVELLGGFPASRCALAPQTLETREFPG